MKRIPEGKKTIEEKEEIFERLMTESFPEEGKDIRFQANGLNRVQNRQDRKR